MNKIYNIELLRTLDNNAKIKLINIFCKLGLQSFRSWNVLSDIIRVTNCLTSPKAMYLSESRPSDIEYTIGDTMPTDTRLKFVRLLRALKKCTNLAEAYTIQLKYSANYNENLSGYMTLTEDELNFIKTIML